MADLTDNSVNLLIPDWPAPDNVKAVVTTRMGGVSAKPFDSFNLATHVDDEESLVNENRQRLMSSVGLKHIQWLEQIHGTKLVESKSDGYIRTADASYSCNPHQACCVLTADCLPVLLCDGSGTQVAAVHAGWKGLAAGIISNSVKTFQARPSEIMAYLGPAISQLHFEVGVDVLEAFYESALSETHLERVTSAFKPSVSAPMKFMADLYALARAELNELGVDQIYGGQDCTFSDSERFYSYRRDKHTGRQASLIWLD